MSFIHNQLNEIKKTIPDSVTLVAVSKTKPPEIVMEAFLAGQKIFGENKPQEMLQKYQSLPKEIDWHMIGHLQTNKVKYIAPFVAMIHSVDSERLLKIIDKEAAKVNRIIPCLLQFHIAQEESKFGFNLQEAIDMLLNPDFQHLKNIRISGVMGMATFTSNPEIIKLEFQMLKSIFETLKLRFFPNNPDFKEISMGMSDDYLLAIREGSTMVRIGSSIFGQR